MADIKIDEIRRQLADISLRNNLGTPQTTPEGFNFSDMLQNAIQTGNQEQKSAEQSVNNYLSGQEPNLHTTLIALEKADMSFKLMMGVRNKLVDAYHEIMRTGV
jgi:flagellar hook-basal body complex protein FliE